MAFAMVREIVIPDTNEPSVRMEISLRRGLDDWGLYLANIPSMRGSFGDMLDAALDIPGVRAEDVEALRALESLADARDVARRDTLDEVIEVLDDLKAKAAPVPAAASWLGTALFAVRVMRDGSRAAT